MIHSPLRTGNIDRYWQGLARVPHECASHCGRHSEHQPLCPTHRAWRDNCHDARDLNNLSRHFYQCSGTRLWGRWMWQMRREGRWVSSQCDCFLGREINHGRFQRISVQMQSSTGNGPSNIPSPYFAAHGSSSMLNTRNCVGCSWPLSMRICPANSWITAKMWKIVDHCGTLHREGKLSQTAACFLGLQVKARLAADRLLCTKNIVLNIRGCLAAGDLVEAWHHLKGWCCLAEDRTPKACLETLARAGSPPRCGKLLIIAGRFIGRENSPKQLCASLACK